MADAIEHGVQAVLAPDVIAIICSNDELEEIRLAFRGALLTQAANRTTTKVCLCICTFEKDGKFRLRAQIRNRLTALDATLRGRSDEIRRAGLKALFSVPRVSVVAPPGFTFVKPSQKRSTHFLRAEEALTEVESVQFLAFSLLGKLSARDAVLGHPVEVIYIDSMAMASVAYALRDLYCTLHHHARPRVVSFHSHEGLKDFDAPLFGTSFCLISASSSMNLGRVWTETTQCHPSEVVTLLTLEGANEFEDALYAMPRPPGIRENAPAGYLKDLPIVGEHFAPEDLLPKSVLLRKKEHNVDAARQFAKEFATSGHLSALGRGEGGTARLRNIYLDGRGLMENDAFQAFIDRTISQKTAASVHVVVHQNDEASRAIAQACAARLQTIMCRTGPLSVVSELDVDGNGNIQRDAALLIVAAVVGRGTRLLSISRDLRNIHFGARTYLIGAQIAETNAQIAALANNLKHSADNATINIVPFKTIAVGAGLAESFSEESAALQGAAAAFGEHFERRHGGLRGTVSGLNDDTFIGTGEDLSQPLRLRPDFAFWHAFYTENQQTTPAVLATIGAILQNAREGKFADERLRLGTDAFQQVILSPENFTRYNDGVIQAALLRCTRSGELDYSRERASSQFMLDLLTNIFEQHDRLQGEAAAEFALAIYLERLRLTVDHLTELRARVAEKLVGDTSIRRLLRVLLGIDGMPENTTRPDGF
ncbi:hypothetical protein [Paraburkholderia fungorum]|uniref:hypothetical protein n=1 Tax=Paraburkholderia fungorum TaxID=134537 RepID=UPI001C1EF9B4|nr:hypothetical protein [Paraburkholderia fungorum]MBU7440265.1 hypothetical protein [Paraburkholderia fungorum]